MSNENTDFMLDHENKTAILWAASPIDYVVLLNLLAPDIEAMGYEIKSYVQPNRPTDVNWEV